MEQSKESSQQHILLVIAILTGVAILMFASLFVFGVNPAEAVCGDGRINCDPWQTGAIYCEDDGIRVLYARSDDSRQGQQALFASRADIDDSGIPSGTDAVLLASNDSAYTLHRLSDARIQFTSPGLELGTLYTFFFHYPVCIGAGPVFLDSGIGGDPNAGSLDTPTPLPPTLTPAPPSVGAHSITCGPNAGEYTLNYSGIGAGANITYTISTNPTVDNHAGTLPVGTGSITFNYSGVGLFNVTGTYSDTPLVPDTAANCP